VPTPQYIASQKGHAAVVAALLAGGAGADKTTDDGRSPLFVASQCGHEAVVALLASGRG
jgi:ankyrin repeat protein